ncbi:hypothetical protein PoB_004850900 [Plakobranchus ocellatus]|uniref:14-3-3 domain-containing protein n=1 Tax=Plakobranchus ocellatus TaxID=259542 RepID=A0AAV4BUF2_9GAST|nr:hypothetical protein PoB_004850900 [Plakobranchus ocellatus]
MTTPDATRELIGGLNDVELLLKFATLSERMERYDDMAGAMKKVIETRGKLSEEEQNLFSVAYKNVIGALRSQWRIISSIEQKQASTGAQDSETELIENYRKQIEREMIRICDEVLILLEKCLSVAEEDGSDLDKLFYLKLRGDYFRYKVEVETEEARENDAAEAEKAYTKATELARSSVPSTHMHRLGLALSFSLFHYEIKSNQKEACELAKQAFDEAVAELDKLKEDSYKASTLIMQQLRDNLTLWTAESDAGEAEDGE